jgi:uncharacterized protein YqhQ
MMGNLIKWIFRALEDDQKGALSLSRVTYLVAFIFAILLWKDVKEVTQYHYYFILINLSYLLFKYKGLDIITKIIDIISQSKKGNS